MQRIKQKGLAMAVMASLMTTLPGTAWAAEQADSQASEVAQMREEIAALTARLNTLEQQLKEKESKDKKAAKAEKSKAPTLKWSGSTKNGFMHDEHKKETVKSEVRLKAKTQVDNTYDVAFGLKFKSTSAEPADGKNGSEKNQVKLDAASIGRAFGPVYVNAGVQSATVGEGLWLGKSSLNIFSARYAMTPSDSLFAGYGRDSQDYLATPKLRPNSDKVLAQKEVALYYVYAEENVSGTRRPHGRPYAFADAELCCREGSVCDG
ncbi:MAG: hypothetical protein PUB57_05945 [Selenomonadaceae bacterium]|nr:hypothetical protein [Selenomonadaceae bacterium]